MADAKIEKTYTTEDIRKIAPEESRRTSIHPKWAKEGLQSHQRAEEVPPPTNMSTKPSGLPNESILADSIFGVNVSVTKIASRQSFWTNFRKLVDIAAETYDAYRVHEKYVERLLVREELSYYATALLQLKLIEVKSKQGLEALTSAEKDIREAVANDELNVPEPISAYLSEIGTYTDKMGKETLLAVPPLPTTVIQNFGGYHATDITADTHNMFEEVPSLGIAGDMVMTLASPDPEPTPNIRVRKPAGSEFTTALAGKFYPIGPRRPEIAQRLAGYGITNTSFAECIPGTRFNLKYLRGLSDIIGKLGIFRINKIIFKNVEMMGGETQVIHSHPSKLGDRNEWFKRTVQPTSATTSATRLMGAAYIFGFQLYKEDGPGTTRTAKIANWSCVIGQGTNPFVMPDDWYENRNTRRNLPEGEGTERFHANAMRQDLMLSNVVRRMIKTMRQRTKDRLRTCSDENRSYETCYP